MSALAVVGTDTGVGKTVISAIVTAAWAERQPVAYWKPVATGGYPGDPDRDTATVARLLGPGIEVLAETYLFPDPLSPHLAARRVGATIEPARLLADLARYRAAAAVGRGLVVEGVGGLLVPLTDAGYLFADFLVAARLPCLLVARSTLGTINHTLLTLEALRAREIPIAGAVLDGPPNPENRRAIERLGRVTVLAEVPPLTLDRPTVAAAARNFDPEGRLWRNLE
ncbi:MAG TPA: dethiobiotin synthase [Thermoanaerobaculia bacterium]|nr:dethiobiotin synthase [Thermoanaerobaculia bacterium]